MSYERVRFAVPGPETRRQRDAIAEACARVIDSGRYVLGEEVSSFESEWAAFVGAPASVGVASGLDAIEIALRSLGVRHGDEVIVPAVSAMATAIAVIRAGATPVFCDIAEGTALIDLEHASRLKTRRTRAVVPVHLYGRAVDMQELVEWASSAGILVVEDAAQAHGAAWGGRSIGTWGDASAFSFYPTKNLGAVGDAGAITSTRQDVIDSARSLRNYGQHGQYEHVDLGVNSRLDEIQAAILRTRLADLSDATLVRQRLAARYFASITNEFVRLPDAPSATEVYVAHLFVINVHDRRSFLDHMGRSGIDCLVHYPKVLSDQPAIRNLGFEDDGLPVARRHVETCVSIPCRPGLSESEADRVIDAINAFEGP